MSDTVVVGSTTKEEFIFGRKRYGDKTGFLDVADIKVGKLYDTQYGNLIFLHEPVMFPNPFTNELAPSALVKIHQGSLTTYRLIDLAWVGLVADGDGLWRQGAYCYDYLHRIFDDLI